jgi:hypothetical protein
MSYILEDFLYDRHLRIKDIKMYLSPPLPPTKDKDGKEVKPPLPEEVIPSSLPLWQVLKTKGGVPPVDVNIFYSFNPGIDDVILLAKAF